MDRQMGLSNQSSPADGEKRAPDRMDADSDRSDYGVGNWDRFSSACMRWLSKSISQTLKAELSMISSSSLTWTKGSLATLRGEIERSR